MKKMFSISLLFILMISLMGCQVTNQETISEPNVTTLEFLGELTIVGTSDLTYTIGESIPDYLKNVEAYNKFYQNISDRIIVDDQLVDYNHPGSYQVTYHVTDDDGISVTVTVFVHVVQDKEPIQTIDHLNIYYLNDTHGNILYTGTQMGLSRIGNLILDEQINRPDNTLFLTGGDILQGALISNYFKGASTIEALNKMNLDAFVLGNHEFDWGLETVTQYFNPEREGIQANFPLLGANVFLKGTTQRPDFIDAYTIIEKAQIKVGVIGLMGFGLERSIAESLVKDYEFADPVYWAEYYARKLRQEEGVDVVLVVIHGADQSHNQAMGSFGVDAKVDAIFNGHTHQATIQLAGTNNVPVIQSGANSNLLGRVRLNLSLDKKVSSYSLVNLKGSGSISFGIELDSRLLTPHPAIEAILLPYYEIVYEMLNNVITQSSAYYSQDQLTFFISKLIRVETESAIGFHNRGGTRISFSNQQNITIDTLYKLFPFDNTLITVYMKGSEIEAFKQLYDGQFFDQDPNVVFQADVYYKVAVTSYIYEKSNYPFLRGIQIDETDILVRDLIIQEVLERADRYFRFNINDAMVKSAERPIPMLSEFPLFDNKKALGLYFFLMKKNQTPPSSAMDPNVDNKMIGSGL